MQPKQLSLRKCSIKWEYWSISECSESMLYCLYSFGYCVTCSVFEDSPLSYRKCVAWMMICCDASHLTLIGVSKGKSIFSISESIHHAFLTEKRADPLNTWSHTHWITSYCVLRRQSKWNCSHTEDRLLRNNINHMQ